MITFDEAVASLLKAGAKKESGLIVKNVTVTELDNYTRIALTIDKEIDGAVSDENGAWSIGKTRIVFVSLYSVIGLLKNTDDAMTIASYVVNAPKALQVLLSGAKISIAQQSVGAHATYVNAWTGEETEHDSDHDSIFNHLIAIEFTDKGRRAIEKIEDKLLGL